MLVVVPESNHQVLLGTDAKLTSEQTIARLCFRLMQLRTISMFLFQSLKFVPLRIETEFTLADTEATEAIYIKLEE